MNYWEDYHLNKKILFALTVIIISCVIIISVYFSFELDSIDDFELHGGGGTDITPFFQALREDQPELAIIFSDGFFFMPDHRGISTDLIWIVFNNPQFTPPIGRVIFYD